MRSLRFSLIRNTVVGAVAILLIAGTLLYLLIEHNLVRNFDDRLANEARLFASTVELYQSRIEFDFEELDVSDFTGDKPSAFLQLWNSDGDVIFRSDSLRSENLPYKPKANGAPTFQWCQSTSGVELRCVSLKVTPQSEDEERNSPQENRLILKGSKESVVLALARDAAPVTAALQTIFIILLSLGLITILVLSVILGISIRSGLKPVNELAVAIVGMDENRLSERIELGNSTKEVQAVVEKMNSLLGRLEVAFKRERQFSADLAHELRTPLSGMRARVEVTLSKLRDTEEYQKSLQDSLEIVLQMQQITETLLSLARLESDLVVVNFEPLTINTLLKTHWDRFGRDAKKKKVSVHWQLMDNLSVVTDADLLGLAVDNIFLNAVVYVDTGGKIRIESGQTRDGIYLRIANTGSKVPAEMAERVFMRFWQQDSARSTTGRHAGLGLPLVQRIVERLGGSAIVESEDGGEFRIIVNLP